jgi:hypothetical protein
MEVGDRLAANWRDAPLVYWFLLFALLALLSIGSSVLIKWMFIGHRRPGPYKETIWKVVADWAVDYHFDIASCTLYAVLFNWRIRNVILMLHGMDIDMESKIYPESFPPSKVDLISLEKLFVSTAPKSRSTASILALRSMRAALDDPAALTQGYLSQVPSYLRSRALNPTSRIKDRRTRSRSVSWGLRLPPVSIIFS